MIDAHFRLIGGSDFKIIYRHYATLYFVFCVDSSESELGILDLIQVSWFENLNLVIVYLVGQWWQFFNQRDSSQGLHPLCMCMIIFVVVAAFAR